MHAIILKALSMSALSIISKLVSQDILENLLTALLKKGATYIANKTGNNVDDEIARIINEKLR